jgi:hypothetical protein
LFTIVGIAGMALVLFICIPNKFVILHTQWFEAVQAHNIQLDQSPNTIYCFLQKIFSSLNLSVVSIAVVLIGLSSVGAAYLLFIWKNIGNGFQSSEALILVALIPVLTHTDTEHFLWAMPFFLMVLIVISTWKRNWKTIGVIALVIASIPFLFNSPDLVGKSFSKQLDEGGIGLSLILLLVLSFLYHSVKFFRNRFI